MGASGFRLLTCRRGTCRSATGFLTHMSFVTPGSVLFQRVFISGGGHYVWSCRRSEPTRPFSCRRAKSSTLIIRSSQMQLFCWLPWYLRADKYYLALLDFKAETQPARLLPNYE